MATIEQVYQDFSQVRLREDLPDLIHETGPELVKLVLAQLADGKRPDGSSIDPSYAGKYYSQKKYGLNSAPGYGVPDLRVTGQLYDQTELVIKSETEYDIESFVDYAQQPSILQYGDVLLPSEDSKQTYCDDSLGPAIGKYILDKTGLVLT